MGLIVAVAVPDGIAVAADGRAVAGIGAGGPQQVVSDTQQKIVQLNDRVAALIPEPYVIADGTPHSLRSALEQVRQDINTTGTLEEVVNELPGRLRTLVPALSDQETLENVFIKLVGVQLDKSVGVVYLDALEAADDGAHSTVETGLNWFGNGDVVARVILGQPMVRPPGVDVPPIQYHIPTQLMSLGDATALAEQLVTVTTTIAQYVIALEHAEESVPFALPVGGHLHSATLTRNGFRWVRKPLMLEHQPSGPDELV